MSVADIFGAFFGDAPTTSIKSDLEPICSTARIKSDLEPI